MQTLKEYALEQLNTNEGLLIPGKDNAETGAYIKSVIDAHWQGRPLEWSNTGDRWHPVGQAMPVRFDLRFRFKRDPVVQALETLTKLRDQMANMCLTGFVRHVDSAIDSLKSKEL